LAGDSRSLKHTPVGGVSGNLKKRKIVWPKQFIVDNNKILIITVDETDCTIWEHKHNNLPKDKQFFSHKISPHVVFIDGPFPAGQFNNITAFQSHLKDKIKKSKKVIVNSGFPPNQQSTTELDILVLPRQGYSTLRTSKSCAHS
jgi:16S rRNA G966 N2-methylase RsmD